MRAPILAALVAAVAVALCAATSARGESAHAYATIVYNDDAGYATGACVLAQSLRETGTAHPLVAIVTPHVGARARRMLRAAGWQLRDVNAIVDPQRPLADMWHYALTKLEVWRMPYARVLYLDADTLVVGTAALDDVFACGEFCAVADPFPTDTFNSGMFVATPSNETYAALVATIDTMPPHSFADQALLNRYFGYRELPAGARLPAAYNVEQPQYADYRRSFATVRVVHYTTWLKPWRFWTTVMSVSAGPWRAARQRLGAHCAGRPACELAAVGDVTAPLAFFSAFALVCAALVATRTTGGASAVPAAAALLVAVGALAASTWHVAAFAAAVAALALVDDRPAKGTARGTAVLVVRVVAVVLAAPLAVAVGIAALPINSNAVAAHAAVYAAYAAFTVAAVWPAYARGEAPAVPRPLLLLQAKEGPVGVGPPLSVLGLPVAAALLSLAAARILEHTATDSAGLIAIIVAVALGAAVTVGHGVAAWLTLRRAGASTGTGTGAKVKE